MDSEFNTKCQLKMCSPEITFKVFQRRIIGDVDFFRNWAAYARGFGNSQGDFWLGMSILLLTFSRQCISQPDRDLNECTVRVGVNFNILV